MFDVSDHREGTEEFHFTSGSRRRQHEKIMEPEGDLKNPRSPRSSQNPWQLLTCVGSGPAGSVIQFLQHLW